VRGLFPVLAITLTADVTTTIAIADPAAAVQATAATLPGVTLRSAGWIAVAAQAPAPDLAQLLEQRIELEAGRTAPRIVAASASDDNLASQDRSRQAERIVRRGVRGALSTQVEMLARESSGLGGALRWIEDFGGRSSWRSAAPGPVIADAGTEHGLVQPATRDRFAAGAGLRLDAHPRVELRARAGSLTGTIDIPLLDHEIRVGLEQPLGRMGRATLRGGHSEERGDWVDAGVVVRF
jgi:hypothetical protein